jgi:CTP synthase
MAVVEHARNVLGYAEADSAEMDPETPDPVIDILPEQYEVNDMGGTMRLGAHQTDITPGSLAADVYDANVCTERHRHRYEVNPEYFEDFEETPLVFSGRAGNRMEILEHEDHPYFLGTQFHPEFRSRPGRPSPPFVGLLDAVMERADVDGADNGDETDAEDAGETEEVTA